MSMGIFGLPLVNVLKKCACLIAICVLSSFSFIQDCCAESDPRAVAIFVNTNGKELCRFKIELAVTPEEQSRGLMFRKDMPAGSGMLFMNKDDDMRSFWMKNTYIPLDIIFIDSKQEVKHVHYRAKPLDEAHIGSRYPVQYILEINAGKAKKCKITPGTKIQFLFNVKVN